MDAPAIPPYSYRIFYDAPSGEYVAECEEIPGLSGVGATDLEALTELKEALSGWLAARAADGLPFPPPRRDEEPTAVR